MKILFSTFWEWPYWLLGGCAILRCHQQYTWIPFWSVFGKKLLRFMLIQKFQHAWKLYANSNVSVSTKSYGYKFIFQSPINKTLLTSSFFYSYLSQLWLFSPPKQRWVVGQETVACEDRQHIWKLNGYWEESPACPCDGSLCSIPI